MNRITREELMQPFQCTCGSCGGDMSAAILRCNFHSTRIKKVRSLVKRGVAE